METIIFKGDWLSIKRATYRSSHGKMIDWEVVERANSETVVIILARLSPSDRFILLRQFRAGINREVIALPAGVVPSGLDIHQQAYNELKEETGYRGRIVEISPPLKINPAILDCDVYIVRMEVDEGSPENAAPIQELEAEEEIEVILKKKEDIKNFLIDQVESGNAVDVACWFVFSS